MTFDADFFDVSNLYGHAPKIIWLKTGDRNTSDLAAILKVRVDIDEQFLTDDALEHLACLEIDE